MRTWLEINVEISYSVHRGEMVIEQIVTADDHRNAIDITDGLSLAAQLKAVEDECWADYHANGPA